MHRWIETAQTL
jgi:pilus assembly protein Flp/PilA